MSGDFFDDNPYATPPDPENGQGRNWQRWDESRVSLPENSADEAFLVNRHSRKRRFSKPAIFVVGIWLIRWTFYLLVPVALCFGAAIGFVFFLEGQGVPEIPARLGGVVPLLLLGVWLWKLPYYYLNGSDLDWQTIRKIKESNGHFDPYDKDGDPVHAFDDFRTRGFNDFDDADEPENLDRFISCNINVQMGVPGRITGFLLDTAYFRLEKYGVRFFGERLDMYVPYSAVEKLVKGNGIYITLKLDPERTGVYIDFTEIIICLGEKRNFREERKLRNAIYERMVEDWSGDP